MMLLLLAAAAVPALAEGNDIRVQGRNITRGGEAFIPFGVVHAAPAEFPRLAESGLNTVALDLAFRDFDPQKASWSDAEVRKALQLDYLDAAHRHGLSVVVLFAFHYTPDWLYKRYPDVRMKKGDGSDGGGGWIPMCLDHPGFRDAAERWLTFAVSRLKEHPATLGYLLWNEPHLVGDVCYSPHTLGGFRSWLKKEYASIGELNAAWGTRYGAFDAVQAPPPRPAAAWFERYDQAATEARRQPPKGNGRPPVEVSTVAWADWMRFRQENYAAFFRWETEVIHRADPQHPVTSKIVPFDLYSSHAYGAGHNTEQWGFLDAVGFDVYSHLDEEFNNRWKSQYLVQMAGDRPVWNSEVNFTFCEERGLPSPETWRNAVWQGIGRGVNGFWFYHWTSGDAHSLLFAGGALTPGARAVAEMAQQVRKLTPLLSRARPRKAEVAVLHSMSTAFHQAGDYAPGADATTLIQALYRIHMPFDFVTEKQVMEGALDGYRVLFAMGTTNLPEAALGRIEAFIRGGGYVMANARFAEGDEKGRPRGVHRTASFGVHAARFHRQPRREAGKLEIRRKAVDHKNRPVDVKATQKLYSSRPMRVTAAAEKLGLPAGAVIGPGRFYGNEDYQMEWASRGRHEETWEDLEPTTGAVAATFTDGRPAIVETMRTLYIGRDTCFLGDEWPTLVQGFLRGAGVTPPVSARDARGREAGDVDVALLDTDRERLLIASRFPLTLVDDGIRPRPGAPAPFRIRYECYGEVRDALTGVTVPSRALGSGREVALTLKPGEVRVLVADKQRNPIDWDLEGQRYRDLRKELTREQPRHRVWQRSPDELWVYDNRPELGIGMHGMPEKQLDMVQALGMRVIRVTLYWYEMEKTTAPGVYDPKYLDHWDDLVARAKKRGIELEVVVHGNAPGVSWPTRKEGYRRFARFMGDMARRYPSVRFWELWNEMDVGFTDLFGAGVTPAVPMIERGRHYAEMLKLAYPAIKRGNPKALVLTGGMVNWMEFPRGIYEGGGRGSFDIMNLHAYGVPVEWGVVMRGATLREVMEEYGDGDRPFWLTELGIDAGGLFAAWGMPKGSPEQNGRDLDRMHREQWEGAIRAAFETGLYAKVLPYQFEAGNEGMRDQLADPEFARKHLPPGMTIDDYGFGLVRRDGVTPRPTYKWLEEAQLNRAIRQNPSYVTDVTVRPAPAGVPVGYRYRRQGDALVIRGVRVDAYAPTQIKLTPK